MRDLIDLLESEHVEFMFEAPADDIIADLDQTDYSEYIRVNGKRVALVVPMSQRQKAIQDLIALFPEAEYDPAMSGSSLGGIKYKGGAIQVKPTGKQGNNSAGVANEIEMINILSDMTTDYDVFTVRFIDPEGKTFEINDAIGIEHAGKDTAGRQKADVRILTKKGKHPISIKKLNAEMWESADSYYGAKAKKLLDKLADEGKVSLEPIGKQNRAGEEFVKVSPEVAVEPTKDEALDVIFGADIELDGAVIFQTFMPQHFVRADDIITIEAEAIIQKLDDVPRSHMMVWLIRNDSTRNPKGGIPGIRITAATQTRAFGKHGTKNVLYINDAGKEIENPMQDIADKYRADQEAKAVNAQVLKQPNEKTKVTAKTKQSAISTDKAVLGRARKN